MSDQPKKKAPQDLRSQQWFGRQDRDGFAYRSWVKGKGIPHDQFDGRPVIGICNTFSELTPCNSHFRTLAEQVKIGVYEAGGFPLEFPVMSLGETLLRPTAMLYRNLASMDVEESIRGNPIDGVVLLVDSRHGLTPLDQQLLEIYTQSVAITFENIHLQDDLRETQKELVYTLADAVEARTQNTGAHVKRVALACEMLARLYGLPEPQVMLIQNASPLHDIGKVAIPDAILHKPGKLNADEWNLMQRHAQFGLDILQRSHRPLMKMAAEIALSHHERWDGSGYPNGLAGTQIPVSARITALADVFDSLGSQLSYKEPWAPERVANAIREGRGSQFEPALVDLLLANLEKFNALRQQHPDEMEQAAQDGANGLKPAPIH